MDMKILEFPIDLYPSPFPPYSEPQIEDKSPRKFVSMRILWHLWNKRETQNLKRKAYPKYNGNMRKNYSSNSNLQG